MKLPASMSYSDGFVMSLMFFGLDFGMLLLALCIVFLHPGSGPSDSFCPVRFSSPRAVFARCEDSKIVPSGVGRRGEGRRGRWERGRRRGRGERWLGHPSGLDACSRVIFIVQVDANYF